MAEISLLRLRRIHGRCCSLTPIYAPVAQVDRASVSGTEGHAFESRQARLDLTGLTIPPLPNSRPFCPNSAQIVVPDGSRHFPAIRNRPVNPVPACGLGVCDPGGISVSVTVGRGRVARISHKPVRRGVRRVAYRENNRGEWFPEEMGPPTKTTGGSGSPTSHGNSSDPQTNTTAVP